MKRKKLNNFFARWINWVYAHENNKKFIVMIFILGLIVTILLFLFIRWDIPKPQIAWNQLASLSFLGCLKEILIGILILLVVYGLTVIIPFLFCTTIVMLLIYLIPMLYLGPQMLFEKIKKNSK